MKRNIWIFTLVFGIILLIQLFPVITNYIIVEELEEYLYNRYEKEFVIGDELRKCYQDKNIKYAYFATLKDDREISFVVGKEKSKNPFPFLPLYNQYVFFDDFFEKAKEYVVEQMLDGNDNFVVNTEADIDGTADEVLNLMAHINKELEDMGFETDKNTASVELKIFIGSRKKEIKFYKMDKKVIKDQIYRSYNE